MRKLLAAVVVLGLLVVMKVPSYAAFTSVGISSYVAQCSFTTQGSVWTQLLLLNLNGTTTNQVYWDTGNISVGTTLWQSASSYILLYSTITNSTGGLQIYTDNKNGSVVAERYTGLGDPAGLVGMSTTTQALPMCWRAVAISTNSLTIKRGSPGPADRLWANELGSGFPCFLWMLDKNSPVSSWNPSGWSNGMDYARIRESVRGVQYAEATWGAMGSPIYIYFGADFTSASSPNTYKTTTLRIESFYQ